MKVEIINLYGEDLEVKGENGSTNIYHARLQRTDSTSWLWVAVLHMWRREWDVKASRWVTRETARKVTDLYDNNPGDGVLTRRAIAAFDEFIKEHEEQQS